MGALIGSTGTSFPFHPRGALHPNEEPCPSGMQAVRHPVKEDYDRSGAICGILFGSVAILSGEREEPVSPLVL